MLFTMKYLLSAILLCVSFWGFSATITSNAVTGNWTNSASWVGGILPGSNDTVVIVNGANISLNTNAIVYKMTINTGGIFNLSDDTLTLAGNNTIGGNLNIYGTFNGNSGAVYLTGNFYCVGTFNSGTSTFVFNASDGQSIGGTTIPSFCNLRTTNLSNGAGQGVSLHPTNTIITGNFIADGTWNRNSQGPLNGDATVTFNGITQLSGTHSYYLNHIVINPGAILKGGNKTIYLYGNFTCNGSFICENNSIDIRFDTNSTCQPDNQNIAVDNPASNPFNNIYVNKTSGKVNPVGIGTNTLGHIYINNNFTVNSGTWNVNGTRQLWVGGNFTINTTATFSASQGRLIMNGSSLTNQMLNAGGDTLYKLTINNSGGGVKLALNTVVTYDLTLTNGILYTRNGALNNELYLTNPDPAISLPAGYSANSYVKGNLRRAVTANTYVFPVGVSNSNSSFYRPITLNITALNGTNNVIICEDSIQNAGTYYAAWWAKILPAGGNPSGTINFNYNLTTDFISGMNECGIMASRGVLTPQVSWNYVLNPSVAASGGYVTVVMPSDFSPYAYILGEPMPVASNTTICSGNSSALNISSPGGYGTFNWYDAQTGGNTLASGTTSYTSPVLTSTTTYWMAYASAPCAAHRWPVTVTVNPIPTSDYVITQPSCYNSCATISYTGTALPSATYTWNFGGGTASPGTGQGPHTVCYGTTGNYNVSLTVTQNSCVSSSTGNTIQVPSQIQVTPTITDASCGASNGSVSLSVTGGWGNYSYNWSNSQTTSDINGLAAGNYHVTISDGGSCTYTATYAVSNLGAPTVTANVTQNTSCFGADDGQVSFSATGTGTMTYEWSNGVTGQGNPVSLVVDTLTAGTYNYTVTDVNSCASSGSFTITQPDELVINSVTTTPLCYNQNNGTITVSTTGGTGTYTYNWAHGSSQPTQINLAEGSYTVTVTDLNNCTLSETIILDQPDTIIINVLTSPISCFGDNNGAINTIVSGGTPPFTYSWTGGYTTPDIDSLTNGTYLLSVLDANNCSAATSVILSQPLPVDIDLNTSNAPCYGVPGGIILTIVSGGTAPYQFNWDNGATTQDLNNLYAGIYWVTVTDDHGCTSVGSTGIQQPDSIQVSITTSSLLCYGDNNGTVQTFVSGGVSPYFYAWDTGAISNSLSGLTGGNYTVTITDSNGCSSQHIASVFEPDEILVSSVTQNISCYGFNDGQITVTVTGGSPNYNISWSNGSTGNIADNLSAGNYSLTVSDLNDCNATYITGVSEPDSIIVTSSYSQTLCWGDSSGYITLSASGGLSPYTWLWSDSTASQSLNMLSAGLYTCTITDANNCIKTETFIIDYSSPIVIELIPNYTAGELLAQANGGSVPYNYLWNNGNTDSLILQAQSGFYSVTVSDVNGCSSENAMTVFYSFEIPSCFTPNNDGKNDTWEIKGIGAYEEVKIEIYNRWGDNIFKYSGTGAGYSETEKQWNGIHNDKEMPLGVFLYIVNIKGISEPFTGTITLVR